MGIVAREPRCAADPYAAARKRFEQMVELLLAPEQRDMSHFEAEELLWKEGMEVLRQGYQDWLDTQGDGDIGPQVCGSDEVERLPVRLHHRQLESRFGQVTVGRLAYAAPGHESLHPLDAQLNLPPEKYSHAVQRLVALDAARSSYAEVLERVEESTAAHVPKRQAEQISQRVAMDFDEFYRERAEQPQVAPPGGPEEIVVLTADGKGVPMLPDSLREATRRARSKDGSPSPGTQAARTRAGKTREAMVGAVYCIESFRRTTAEVISELRPVREALERRRPQPRNKRVFASLVKDRKRVVKELFDQAERLDPEHSKQWVVLLDGLEHPIALFKAEARRRGVSVLLILDLLHVLSYLWTAAFALRGQGTAEAETQVATWLEMLLSGCSSRLAAAMRRSATMLGLDAATREPVDTCARYLLKHTSMMRYGRFLTSGFPIATGVIEGACRYLVKDRMERTGARWSLQGGEAVLRLRALWTNDHFDEYWAFHQRREHERNHASRYATTDLHRFILQPLSPGLREVG